MSETGPFLLGLVPYKAPAEPEVVGRIIQVTASRALTLSDNSQILESKGGDVEVVLTIPPRAEVDFQGRGRIDLARIDLGTLTIDPADGVTLNGGVASLHVAGQHRGATLYERGPDDWELIGGVP